MEFLGKNWEDLPKVASGGVCDGNAYGVLKKHASRQSGSNYEESGKEAEL